MPDSVFQNIKENRKKRLAGAAAVTRRRQNRGKGAVSVKAEQQSGDNGQAAAAEKVRAENTVLRTEYE